MLSIPSCLESDRGVTAFVQYLDTCMCTSIQQVLVTSCSGLNVMFYSLFWMLGIVCMFVHVSIFLFMWVYVHECVCMCTWTSCFWDTVSYWKWSILYDRAVFFLLKIYFYLCVWLYECICTISAGFLGGQKRAVYRLDWKLTCSTPFLKKLAYIISNVTQINTELWTVLGGKGGKCNILCVYTSNKRSRFG